MPGLHVALNSGNRWAVSARGFSSLLQDKLLVLIDGRSVYSPLQANVYWDVQDTLLEDVDRIEVIRGPGGTLWGSNAVNGVINILTKSSGQSQGTYLNAGGGFVDQGFVEARKGGQLGQIGHWKIYGKYARRTSLADNGTTPADDPTDQVRGGLRSDLSVGPGADLTIQGDSYHGHSQAPGLLVDPTTLLPSLGRTDGNVFGAHLLTRLTLEMDEHTQASVQMYYDLADRDERLLDYHRQTYDLEFQHRFRPLEFTDLTWGAGYRMYRDDFDKTRFSLLDPESRSFDLLSGFVQSDVRLLDGRLRLTVGTKLERNDFSGLEHQPNVRVAFVPGAAFTLWGAISRVARTPDRVAEDGSAVFAGLFPPVVPLATEIRKVVADPPRAEDLVAYELGARMGITDRLWIDVAGYHHEYDNLISIENGALFCSDGTPITGAAAITACGLGGNRLLQTTVYKNRVEAKSWGAEAFVRFEISDDWQLDLSYSHFRTRVELDRDSTFRTLLAAEEASPEHQVGIRSRMNLRPGLTLDAALFWVDELRALDVDAYVRLDLRVGWQVTDRLQVSVVGQNLIEEHEELANQFFYASTRVPRSAFVAFTWRY